MFIKKILTLSIALSVAVPAYASGLSEFEGHDQDNREMALTVGSAAAVPSPSSAVEEAFSLLLDLPNELVDLVVQHAGAKATLAMSQVSKAMKEICFYRLDQFKLQYFTAFYPLDGIITAYIPGHGLRIQISGGLDLTNTAVGQFVVVHPDKLQRVTREAEELGVASLVGTAVKTAKAKKNVFDFGDGPGNLALTAMINL